MSVISPLANFGKLLATAMKAYQEKARAVLDDADTPEGLLECNTVEGVIGTLEGGMSDLEIQSSTH